MANRVFTPVSALLSLWALNVSQVKLVALPALGVAYHLAGILLALLLAWFMGVSGRQRGVFVMAGLNGNLGLIGGLLCYLFYGETGFALSAFFRLFELPLYFLVGYPLASAMGTGQRVTVRGALRQVVTDPALFLPILGIIGGIALSRTGVPRPEWLTGVNAILIPLAAINMAFAVGVTLRAGAVKEHLRACGAMAAVKFAALPAVVWGLGTLVGLDQVDGGLPLKVAVLLSFMPVGFNAILAATLFNLDEEMANALWLSSTVLVLPVLAVLMPMLG